MRKIDQGKIRLMGWMFAVWLGAGVLLSVPAFANNITVSNVSLQNQNAAAGTVEVKFDVTWSNSFTGNDGNGAAFYDRAWIFIKYWVQGVDDENTGWHHAILTTAGTLSPVSDGLGAYANIGTNQTLKWKYTQNSVSGSATVKVKVCALEMVYIPTGNFIYNAGNAGGSTNNNFGAGVQTTVSSAAQVPTGAAVGWPNGYNAFYVAKYEVSQGQLVDYLNMLPKGTAVGLAGAYTTTGYGSSITYTAGSAYGVRWAASYPNRAIYFGGSAVSLELAYASWTGLRPVTEMEWEKVARGGGADARIYPWGNVAPDAVTYTVEGKYVKRNYANIMSETFQLTPVGLYLSADVPRTNDQTGASIYGVADLLGNDNDGVFGCSYTTTPPNGNGTTNFPASWPMISPSYNYKGSYSYGGGGAASISSRTAWPNYYVQAFASPRLGRTAE